MVHGLGGAPEVLCEQVPEYSLGDRMVFGHPKQRGTSITKGFSSQWGSIGTAVKRQTQGGEESLVYDMSSDRKTLWPCERSWNFTSQSQPGPKEFSLLIGKFLGWVCVVGARCRGTRGVPQEKAQKNFLGQGVHRTDPNRWETGAKKIFLAHS